MLIELIRLGRDAELRALPDGKQVLNFTGAYDVGYGQNKKTVWVKCSIWGDRAAKVEPFMKKGTQLKVCLSDVEPEAWANKQGEPQAALKGRVVEFTFAGTKSQDNQESQPQGEYNPYTGATDRKGRSQDINQPQSRPVPHVNNENYADFDDDIPF